MSSNNSSKKTKGLLVLALLLILVGGLLAYWVQTDGNTIKIKDVRFIGSDGKLNSALLYIPPGVSKKNPAPGIVAIHGYINSRETQDGFAIEFARRGYVVLCADQSGHGFADPPAFGNCFGGLDALNYINTLDIVDRTNIGFEGHSMGGYAAVCATAALPNSYKSVVLASSAPGLRGTPEGTPTFPRNVGLIFSQYDEFYNFMWNIKDPKDFLKGEKLKAFFGTTEPVEIGKVYGSIEEGTARKLYRPPVIHPRVHFSREGIGNAIEWMQLTLKGGKNIPVTDQTWYWKEIGTFIAMIGMILLLFPLGQLLLQTNFFKELNEATPERKSIKGAGWWVGALITAFLPVPLFIWMYLGHAKGIQAPTAIWPQNLTTTIMYWALSVAVVSLVLFLLWHFLLNRKNNATFVNYGLTWKDKGLDWIKIGKSFLLATIVCVAAYLTLTFSAWAFTTDYRLWVFAIKPMTFLHFRMFLGYFIPFLLYFLTLGLCIHGQLRRGKADGSELPYWKEAVINIVVILAGYFVIEMYHYIPLFAGGPLGIQIGLGALWFIVMFQFFPLFAIVALVSTYFYRKTGHIYAGIFLSAMLVTWIVVAGQATHYAFK
jgi:pimeloyl-ACP methyl ester carboxylesterase